MGSWLVRYLLVSCLPFLKTLQKNNFHKNQTALRILTMNVRVHREEWLKKAFLGKLDSPLSQNVCRRERKRRETFHVL